ncbi:MAG TPA: hypothetical protein VKA46_16335 [Gemmataceae bacterium]|nr:hypothetical protein [Gemmataceae bacterium]
MTAPTAPKAAFQACVAKLLDLHFIRGIAAEDSPQAEALRDEMDPLWQAMTEEERGRIGALSEDLAVIAEGGPSPVTMSAEERAVSEARWQTAYASQDWDSLLDLLRRPQSDRAPDEVAFLQAQFWERLAGPDAALVFLKEAARLNPATYSNVVAALEWRTRAERELVHHITVPTEGPETNLPSASPTPAR